MNDKLTMAGVQMEPKILEKEKNLERCLNFIQVASEKGARLIVFPEAALSGYIFSSLEDALPTMEPIPGPSTEVLITRCRELNVYVIIGLLEADGGKFYNSATLLGPQGLVGKYRKLHLPSVGIDRFLSQGDLAPTVYETEIGRIGIGICYDSAFPEHARVLALQGADLIVNITNGPEGAEFSVEHLAPTRARENHIYFAAINRTGIEGGVAFFGRSKIVQCDGETLAEGKPYEEDIIYAEIEPALARDKRRMLAQGASVSDVFKDRRPEFYGILTQR